MTKDHSQMFTEVFGVFVFVDIEDRSRLVNFPSIYGFPKKAQIAYIAQHYCVIYEKWV